ncbi:NAD(P)-dependent oxidoreductase [Amycolatopsis rubida]|uniref:NAD(P)-dependent oxidoreductase n=1 Tax=Amycolatopsis rubida TaxID=112413 RepID=A0ABX0BZU7_9PSEU|nr:NAD(P)-dependent oxidoreductase [Amycolatopsis sp. M39]MYW96119.1 NAD-binding protein [Amycolatopsis rubida]NEC61110.1 NAD(P)-dependent oxidoreductase [Amycolatopsis rubida]OAP23367.1 2-hydroxy-3-oxopropionate reductase [Amycolatopsis sp. M39]
MGIGYIGLGDMGGALAIRLQSQRQISVYDRDAAAMAKLAAEGAIAAESAADLARTCTTVLLCLPTSDHVRSVIFGEGGLAETLAPGSLVIDQTSGDPTTTRELAAELAAYRITLADAPVSGGAPAALAGTISIMLGAADGVVDRASEVLRSISQTIAHVGAVGAGHTIKLVNNLLSCSQRWLSLEALALAVANGITAEAALKVLVAGGGRNAYLEQQGIKILDGDRDRGFSMGLAHKDLKLATALGASSGVPTFFGSLSRDLYQVGIAELGRDSHVETVASVVEKLAGVELKSVRAGGGA